MEYTGVLSQQLQGLLSSPAISANAVSSFKTAANAITKGVDVSFTLVDTIGVSTITLRRNYLNDMATATVLQSWSAMLAPYTWSDTDAALQTSGAAYYWLVLSPTGTTGKATNIGPQEIVLNPQIAAPTAVTSISASHGDATNGAVIVTVNVSGVPTAGSVKIYVTGYQGNSNPVAVAQQTSSPLQFPLLQTGETVTFKAIGVSAGGTEAGSGPTTTLVLNGAATVPAEPQEVTVAQLTTGNQITFPASLDNVTSYQIWRANQGDPFSSATLIHTITPTNVGTIEYLDTGAYTGHYEYFVVAVNAAGSSLPSDAASAQFISATSVLYVDGQQVQALQPAAQGADVTADQPIVYTGLSANLVPNSNFLLGNIKGWITVQGAAAGYDPDPSIFLPAGTGVCSPTFNTIPGQKYRFSWRAWSGGGTQSTFFRINGSPSYLPNIYTNLPYQLDFLVGGSIYVGAVPGQTYTYDWTCPANVNFISMLTYNNGTNVMAVGSVSCQDYVAAAEWGADVTGANTAANTTAVGSLPAGDITSTILPGGGVSLASTVDGGGRYAAAQLGADKTLNHVISGVIAQDLTRTQIKQAFIGAGVVYTVATFNVISNGTSDQFNLYAVMQWEPNGAVSSYSSTPLSWITGYVDAPGFVGTAPNYGVTQPTPGTYVTFGYGNGSFTNFSNLAFFGNVSGLSAGTHSISLVFTNNDTSHVPYLDNIYASIQQISS